MNLTCPHCGQEYESAVAKELAVCPSCSRKYKEVVEASKGLKIFDYVLVGVCVLEGIFQLYKKFSGISTRQWFYVILPFIIAVGLMQHKTLWRVICIILLAGSILLPFILAGMVSSYY